ncbi:protein monoglycylase TTLL8 isoform 5-T10 [Sarcophilus harrisii]
MVPNGEDECEGDYDSGSNVLITVHIIIKENKYVEIEEDNEMIFQKSNNIHDVMSRLVKTEIPYFLWTIKRDVVDYHNLSCDQMLNHYGKTASFTTKIGLCMNMRNLPWYVPANPHSFFPRCYGLCSDGEKQEFLDDFRRTAASSILKWVVSHHNYSKSKSRVKKEENDEEMSRNKDQVSAEEKKLIDLPGELIEVACKVCENYLGQLEHDDIDISAESLKTLSEGQWKELIQQYYNLIHGNACISSSKNYFSQCQSILNKIMSANPQSEIDGMRNIWILKPGAKSRGRDIICMDRVEEIMKLVTSDNIPSKDNKWVVQKYIETPLLIYDTKFDIRQWFLVTDWNPLTIWFYKESYLRFSTQRFSLDSLDSAIHLCNNSIQKHFKNAKDRSPLLPCYNMWTSTKFQEYLQKRGRGHVWHNIIYPSMKKAITHTMKVAQDHVEARKNSFELYGADFILGKDFKPWLIEINSSPTMFPSTPVTAQLCAQVQEDTIKVVVDRKTDRNCDIGNFELLWKQPAVELPPFNGSNLFVEGFSIQKGRRHMTPIANISLGSPLPAGHMLRSRCFSTQHTSSEQTPSPKQDAKSREDKGHPCILPMPMKRGSGRAYKINSVYTKALGNMEFPSFAIRHLENISHKSVFPRAKTTKLEEPNMLSTASIASVLQSIRSLENPVFQPPKGSGNLCYIPSPTPPHSLSVPQAISGSPGDPLDTQEGPAQGAWGSCRITDTSRSSPFLIVKIIIPHLDLTPIYLMMLGRALGKSQGQLCTNEPRMPVHLPCSAAGFGNMRTLDTLWGRKLRAVDRAWDLEGEGLGSDSNSREYLKIRSLPSLGLSYLPLLNSGTVRDSLGQSAAAAFAFIQFFKLGKVPSLYVVLLMCSLYTC